MPARARASAALRLGLLLLGPVCPSEARVETGTMRLGHGGALGRVPWQYVGKFGYAIGTGEYEVRLKLRQPPAEGAAAPRVNLEVFLDEDWASASKLAACDRGDAARTTSAQLRAGTGGKWGDWAMGALFQSTRPHIWYFALSSCSGGDGEDDPEGAAYDVEYEIRFRQFDGSELSVEMRHMLGVSALAMLGLAALSARFTLDCQRTRRSLGTLHPVIWVLAAALKLQCAAPALHAFHLFSYEQDGVGAPLADALAEVFLMSSQVVNATLLIVIAQGYTLHCSRLLELPYVRPIIAVVAALHVVLVSLGKLQGEASYKYHENEGALGWALLALRLLLFAWFRGAIQSLRRSGSYKLQHFLNRFELVGSLYLLAYPVLLAVVQVFAPYLRHPILQTCLLAMQAASSVWLAGLFLSRGSYFEVSVLSLPLLPGGSHHSGIKKA